MGGNQMRILALTVGGSPKPVIRSIKEQSPDKVVFFVTVEPRGGSKKFVVENTEEGESIVGATKLTRDRYELVEILSPDSLADTFQAIYSKLKAISSEHPGAEKIADYTGGTKTMSVSLALAALRLGWTLSLVTGMRADTEKVLDGTELVERLSLGDLKFEDVLEEAGYLFDLRNYEGADEALSWFSREFPLSAGIQKRLNLAITLVRGFAAWDRFEHEKALALLRPCARFCVDNVRFLWEIVEGKSSGYAKVWDLIRNAERRAERGQYDDGVMRLYRAVELLAQYRLKERYGLDTGDLDPQKIPEPLRKELLARAVGKRVTAGLVDSFRILSALGDPLGELYSQGWEEKLKDVQGRRNQSVLAHGLEPIGKEEWDRCHSIVSAFVKEALDRLGKRIPAPQFPKWEKVFPSAL
jgi:hypothetical protein